MASSYVCIWFLSFSSHQNVPKQEFILWLLTESVVSGDAVTENINYFSTLRNWIQVMPTLQIWAVKNSRLNLLIEQSYTYLNIIKKTVRYLVWQNSASRSDKQFWSFTTGVVAESSHFLSITSRISKAWNCFGGRKVRLNCLLWGLHHEIKTHMTWELRHNLGMVVILVHH